MKGFLDGGLLALLLIGVGFALVITQPFSLYNLGSPQVSFGGLTTPIDASTSAICADANAQGQMSLLVSFPDTATRAEALSRGLGSGSTLTIQGRGEKHIITPTGSTRVDLGTSGTATIGLASFEQNVGGNIVPFLAVTTTQASLPFGDSSCSFVWHIEWATQTVQAQAPLSPTSAPTSTSPSSPAPTVSQPAQQTPSSGLTTLQTALPLPSAATTAKVSPLLGYGLITVGALLLLRRK